MVELVETFVTMTHEDLPGVTKVVNILAYRYAYYDDGWRSSDDPDWTGADAETPQPSLGSLDLRLDDIETTDWWDRFTSVPVNGIDNVLKLTYNPSTGVANARGVGGAGNERRFFVLPNQLMADAELYFEYDIIGAPAGAGQTGLVLRRQGDVAVIVWQNIVFGANGNMLQGTWEYDGRTLIGTNQDAENAEIWGSEIVSAVGNGTTVTVTAATPHPPALVAGGAITLVGVGAFGDVTVASIPTSTTFTFASATVGSWTGGRWKWNLFAPTPNGRRKVRARLVGNTVTFHQWITGQDEPSWSDSTRTITNTIPATLGTGKPRPIGLGEVGFVLSHLGEAAQVNIYGFEATSLDGASPSAPTVENWRFPRSPDDALEAARRIDTPSPFDQGLIGWAFDPATCQTGTALTGGVVNLTKVFLREPRKISTIHWAANVASSGATAGQNHVGLYKPDGTRIATTDITSAVGSTGRKDTAITPVTVSDVDWVWVAWVLNASTSNANLLRGFVSGVAGVTCNVGLTAATARFGTILTGQTTLPTTITPGSIGFAGIAGPWAALS